MWSRPFRDQLAKTCEQIGTQLYYIHINAYRKHTLPSRNIQNRIQGAKWSGVSYTYSVTPNHH